MHQLAFMPDNTSPFSPVSQVPSTAPGSAVVDHTAPPGDDRVSESRTHGRVGRVMRFGREHPVLAVSGLTGIGLLGGVELAAGILLGAGVTALLRRPNGQGTAPAAEEKHGRIRGALVSIGHLASERARAVITAVRGHGQHATQGERASAAVTSHDDVDPCAPR